MSKRRNPTGLSGIDLIAFSFFLGLVGVGWLMVYTVSYQEGLDIGDFLSTPSGKQTIWIGISAFAFAFIILIDATFWQSLAYPIYITSLVLLVGVLVFGANINGATSWYRIGSFTFQPSEIAKFGTSLALASYLSSYSTNLREFRSQITSFSLFLVPIALIMLQSDPGSALVFMSFLIPLYREGLSANFYIVGIYSTVLLTLGLVASPLYIAAALLLISVVVMSMNFEKKLYWLMGALLSAAIALYLIRENGMAFLMYIVLGGIALFALYGGLLLQKRKGRVVQLLMVAIIVGVGLSYTTNYVFNNVLKPHHQNRINAWLRPELCDKASLYNIIQSKMAIGSGGWDGKGFLRGTMTKLNYVPEQTTDFIFCTVGEEQGFIGSFAIITLFLLFLIRITIIAERQKTKFARIYAYSIAGILFVHFLINIGMTMGLMPVIGIPLPFISKGGSSLLGFTVMIAVLLKLDSSRNRV
ncbi:MAG: rod shape-determining protein RodA [Saprospiraceae bacterium]|nr:rod shape-determining protein RodA [Saprospiraceae bacterium]